MTHPRARERAVLGVLGIVGALALLGLAMGWVSGAAPDNADAPPAKRSAMASAPHLGTNPAHAPHATGHAGANPPCRTHTDAEGNIEADCSAPLALNNPFH